MDFKIPLFIDTSLPVMNDSPKSTPHLKRNHIVYSRNKSRSPIVHRVSIDEDEDDNEKKKKNKNKNKNSNKETFSKV